MKPKPPVQRWLVTHKYTGGAIGTVRDQFAFGARRKSGPELQIDVDQVEVRAVGETPVDTCELAKSLGLSMHDPRMQYVVNRPDTETIAASLSEPTDVEKRIAKLEKRVRRLEEVVVVLQRMAARHRPIGGRR